MNPIVTTHGATRSRRALLIASTCLSCGLAAPAMAQSSVPPMPGPPVYSSVDENNVDLTTGIYRPSVELAAVGPKEDELKFVYSPDTYTSNLSGSIYVTTGVIGTTTYKFYKVSTDSTSAIFIQPPNAAIFSYINSQGQSLVYDAPTQIYTYTNRQGIVYKFSKSPSSSLGNGDIISKKDVDGRTLTYAYVSLPGCGSTCKVVRQVVSNKGYAVWYDYDSTSRISKITAYNMSVDYCDATAATCTFSRVWPSSSVTQYPDYKSIAFTDEMNRTLSEIWSGTTATVTSPTGKQAIITTDSANRVTSVSRGGGTWNYSYTTYPYQFVANVVDPLTQGTTYTTLLSVGQFEGVSDAVRNFSFGYNTNNGDLTSYSQLGGVAVGYTRDSRSNITQTTLAAKSGSGLTSIVTTSGFDTTCATPACNKPNWTKDAKGNQTDYTYDPVHGGVLTVTLPAATAGGVRPQRRYTYAQLSTYAKTSTGTLAQLGSFWVVTGISECATGASCGGTADETKTTISYTGSNNLQPTSVTVAAGDGSVSSTTTTTYDPNGDIVSVDGPLPGSDDTVTNRYDLGRNLVGTISPDPDGAGPLKRSAAKISYNADGQPTLKEAGIVNGTTDADWAAFSSQQQATTNYDSNGRKASEVITAGGTTYGVSQYGYDIAGRLDCTAVRMNNAQWASLPPSACTPQPTGSAGADRITKLSYDAVNRVTKVTGAYGTSDQSDERTVTYTISDKAQTETDARGNITTYTYDGFDRLVARAFPSKTVTGNSATCTIGTIAETTDGFGNTVTSPSETRTAGDDCEKYAYDRNGNRATLMKRDGNVIRYAYDALNRNTVKDIPGGTAADVYYGYNLGGLLTFARFVSASGLGISNTYDGLGRLSSTTNNMGFAPLALGYLYDADGNRIRITYPDGTYFTYDYDALGRATTIKANGASTIATITYDNQGRRAGDTRSGASTSYGYDSVSRLTNLSNDLAGTTNDVTNTFGYNPASQIVTKTRSNDAYGFTGYVSVSRAYAVNGLNQYTAAGGASFTYDDNGNLTGDGTNTYAYDVENRMVGVTTAAGTATLIYDPLGRLWQHVRAGGGGAAWQFLHDGDDIVERYNFFLTGLALNTRYVHGPGTDEPLVWYGTSSIANPMGLQSDYQGSIVSSVDASGNLTGLNAYDEYGIPTTTFAGTRPLFGYTGQVWFPAPIGLYYYKARMYSPTLGRFMQTDPIGYGDGMNSYNYVGGDPINGTDPTGLETYIQNGDIATITGHRNCVDRGDCLSNYDDLFRMYGIGSQPYVGGNPTPPLAPGSAAPCYSGGYNINGDVHGFGGLVGAAAGFHGTLTNISSNEEYEFYNNEVGVGVGAGVGVYNISGTVRSRITDPNLNIIVNFANFSVGPIPVANSASITGTYDNQMKSYNLGSVSFDATMSYYGGAYSLNFYHGIRFKGKQPPRPC